MHAKNRELGRNFRRTVRYHIHFVFVFHRSLLLGFSLHFSSSSAFHRFLFRQSSHLPRFLQPHSESLLMFLCLRTFFSNLACFILSMCPAHFIRLLFFQLDKPYFHPTSSLRSFIILLSTIFTLATLLIQNSHTCSLCCCCLDIATIFMSYVLLLAGDIYWI